jgi:hypothetical protein
MPPSGSRLTDAGGVRRIKPHGTHKMTRKSLIPFAALALAVFLGAGHAAAQEPKTGPLTPPPSREVKRIPAEKAPEPPSIPVEEIIRRFTQKEDEFLRARAAYTFRKTVRVQEFSDDGKVSGEFQIATEPAAASDGRRYERVVQQPPSTLRRIPLAPEDLEILARIPVFPLTTEQLSKYELSYTGKQLVDEISAYTFRITPRQLERTRAYFDGLIWVDDRDLLVVKTYGKWVTEVGDVSTPELPFTTFETYRENIDGKYWFPTYTRSDDYLRQKAGELHIRLTVRWTDYKPLGNVSATPAAATPPPDTKKPQ